MKRILFLVGLAIIFLSILALSNCSQQKAIDTMMANPEMSAMLIQKIMDTPELKVKMTGMMISDTAFVAHMMATIIGDHSMMDQMMEKMMGDGYCKQLISQKGKELTRGKK